MCYFCDTYAYNANYIILTETYKIQIKMKKILSILLLAVFFTSCISEAKNEDLVPEPPGEGIDAKLIGKWKVLYAYYVAPAVFVENEEQLEKYKKYVDYVRVIGVNRAPLSVQQGYHGGDEFPVTGVFTNGEVMIEIKTDNTIDIYVGTPSSYSLLETVAYSIEDGYLKWKKYTVGSVWGRNKYKYEEGDKLFMELVGNDVDGWPLEKYRSTIYQRVTE